MSRGGPTRSGVHHGESLVSASTNHHSAARAELTGHGERVAKNPECLGGESRNPWKDRAITSRQRPGIVPNPHAEQRPEVEGATREREGR
jgi:hypothetical protein